MQAFKKIVAATVMVISALTFVLLLVGIIGSWFVNAQLKVAGANLLLTGETSLVTVRQGLGTADRLLTVSLDGLNEVERRANQLGETLADNTIIVDGIAQRLNLEIAPTVTRASDQLNAVEANLIAINDAIIAIDAIPMLRVDISAMPGLSLISETLDMMQQIREDVRTMITRVETRRQELITGTTELVLDPARELNGRLQNVSDRLTDADARLATTIDTMRDLRERLPAILNWITIAVNILFALSMLAFASLFSHALQYYRCPDDGLRGLLPPERCYSQMLPATVVRPGSEPKAAS